MKAFAKTTLITGTAFGVPMGVVAGIVIGVARDYLAGVLVGLATASVLGLAFGLLMAMFMAVQRRRGSGAQPDFNGEHLVHDGPANHFLNGEGVGGWLYLTEHRLMFRSHQFNIQPHELSMPLTEVSQVNTVRTARIIPNGLRIVSRSGCDERFVVEANRRWCDEIAKAQARAAQQTS